MVVPALRCLEAFAESARMARLTETGAATPALGAPEAAPAPPPPPPPAVMATTLFATIFAESNLGGASASTPRCVLRARSSPSPRCLLLALAGRFSLLASQPLLNRSTRQPLSTTRAAFAVRFSLLASHSRTPLPPPALPRAPTNDGDGE